MPIIFSALITFSLGYALVSGLAFSVVKKTAEDLKTFDVTEPPPPPEEKPPPPQKTETPPPPQISAPPPLVRMETPAPPIQTTPVMTPAPIITPTAKPAPPAPPAPPPVNRSAQAKANLASYFTDSDYPPAAQDAQQQGTTRFSLTVGPDGRVSDCQVTGSSGSSSLDQATCNILRRRARFTPAMNTAGQAVSGSASGAIKWVLPAE
ncbi:energy transducer TonB [Sphingomonas sp. ASV193]|uniref:energy transducer TonB n=1 Tax=Sphingomonas sp. ASV193 TaxID=3144405 RepID=UPI0032E91474